MNNPDPKSKQTLENLLTDCEQRFAPTVDSMLIRIRREKVARSRRQITTVALVFTFAVALILGSRMDLGEAPKAITLGESIESIPAAPSTVTLASNSINEPDPPEWKVERINDQQLLEMLDGHPVALVNYPGGYRRLMIMVQLPSPPSRKNVVYR